MTIPGNETIQDGMGQGLYGLPDTVLHLIEFSPVEDILLAIIRESIPEVPVYSLIPDDAPPMFILVRRMPGLGRWDGDPRFVDSGRFYVHTFTTDPDGDEKGALLSEAVRVVLRNAWLEHKGVPGRGYVISINMQSEPSRRSDWATASGPVQFADLPTGMWRYEATYDILVRKYL